MITEITADEVEELLRKKIQEVKKYFPNQSGMGYGTIEFAILDFHIHEERDNVLFRLMKFLRADEIDDEIDLVGFERGQKEHIFPLIEKFLKVDGGRKKEDNQNGSRSHSVATCY